MSTDIVYNGIELRNVFTERFEQNIVLDPSGTDQIRSDFTIAVQCLVNYQAWNQSIDGSSLYVMGVGDDSFGGLPASYSQQVLNQIRAALTTNRALFTMWMESTIVLQIDGTSPATTDVNNGPKVLYCHVDPAGPAVFRIRWAIQISRTQCTSLGTNPQFPAINNRWRVIDVIEPNQRTIRTWDGVLTLASLPAGTLRTPHLYRYLCVPPLAKGWQRGPMRFTSEPDGLKLGYSVTDEEMPCESPPYPAHKYRVDHSKSWSSPVGARTVENVRVVLEGPALVDRNFLCSRAFQIALSRARALTAKEFGRRLIRGLSVSESFGNDGGPILCTCEITTEHNDSVTTPGKQTTGPVMGAMDMNPIGQILTLPQPESESDPNYYDPNRMWLPGDPFGTGIGNLIYTLTALWQTPCTGDHDNRQGMAPWPPKPPVQVGIEERPSVTWQQGVPTQMEGAGINSQSIEHPYNYARIESEFHTNHGWIGLPLAAAPAEGAATIGIQVHAPTTIRVVKAFFERVGEWPIIHKAKKFTDSSGVVHWPTKTTLVSRTKEKLPDNKDLYSLNYEYVFQLDREYTDIQPLPVGVLPWDTQTQNDTRIPRTAFIEPDDNNKGLS